MERHAIDEASAFELLREHSGASNRRSSTSPPPSSTATACSPNNPRRRPRPDAKPCSARAAHRLEALGATVALG
jgi:hypothetical protein